LPVKIFRPELGRNKEEDMLEMEDEINQFEKELEEQEMQIRNITMSASVDYQANEFALYSIVHYSSRSSGE
jgi:hypothetical protein